ncbi:MAG: hypothetical protein IJQ39_10520, partial [Thermoguttaceae bacterium]|nr:hypothetical protein [Thermoguttaceae bacterium]
GFAARRLKSTVIEMASILDAMNVPAFHVKSAPLTPSSASPRLRVSFCCAAEDCREPAHQCA